MPAGHEGGIHRWVNGKIVRVGSPEDAALRKQEAAERGEDKVIVDPGLEKEADRLRAREDYIAMIESGVQGGIRGSQERAAQAERMLRDYAQYEDYRRLEIARVKKAGGGGLWRGGLAGPNQEDWRAALENLAKLAASQREWSGIYAAADQALKEARVPEGKGNRLDAAIELLDAKAAALQRDHVLRQGKLWEIYHRLEQEPDHKDIRQIYAAKRQEWEEEEQELARLAKAKDYLARQKKERAWLFE